VIEPREYIAAVVYTVLAIIICAVKTIGNNRYAEQEFFERSRLEQTSTRDYLTHAATRERLEEEARRWMNFCRRQGLPLCLVFVDVDDLKRINDRYGHAMGDAALKEIANLMHTQLRNSDTIARWGGDEFVLLLPNVTLQNALLLLDRVKSAVKSLTLDGGVTVSCSFGVVQMGAHSTYAELLAEADAMMYRAKNGGKGRISYPNAYLVELD
jgi:diguanylate cyclase (GGDEF)-like protein